MIGVCRLWSLSVEDSEDDDYADEITDEEWTAHLQKNVQGGRFKLPEQVTVPKISRRHKRCTKRSLQFVLKFVAMD